MSRYIDADATIEKIKQMKGAQPSRHCGKTFLLALYNSAEILISETPTADVVSREQYNACYEDNIELRKRIEIVHCSECKHHCRPYAPLDRTIYCGIEGVTSYHGGREDFYCADGEKL